MVPIPVMVTAQRASLPASTLQPHHDPRRGSLSAQEVLQGRFPDYAPRNLEQEHNFRLGIPTSEEPEFPDLDFGQWERDADVSLLTLGHESYDFGSLACNSFRPTEEETHVMATSSSHEKKVLKAHEQFIQMLGTHEATKAFASYDSTYGYQFYRIFQGTKSIAKRNAMNNIMALWSELFIIAWTASPISRPALCLF